MIRYARRRRQGFTEHAAGILSGAGDAAVGYLSAGIIFLCTAYVAVEVIDLFF